MFTISVTPELRSAVDKAVDMERKDQLAMGYRPDELGGTYVKEMLPLQERLKSDVVDLNDQEVSLLHYLLLECQAYLRKQSRIELVPASYTKRIHKLLAYVDNFLETLPRTF